MRHFKLTIAYEGTDFHGWQMQSNKPTVQGEIVNVLERVTQERVFLHGAGRTDAGVHALGQVASFKTQSALSAEEFQRALNALLPPTIRIVAAEEVGPDFHARWSARRKTYRYRLYRGKVVPPSLWRYVLHYPFPLDEDAMRDAAARFIGTHDFTAFAASADSEDGDRERSTEREIYAAELARSADGEELVFVQGGYLEVQPHLVSVLADTAIRAKDLDEKAALDAKRAAEEAMQNKTSKEEIAHAEAELAIALAQLEAIRKLRHRA